MVEVFIYIAEISTHYTSVTHSWAVTSLQLSTIYQDTTGSGPFVFQEKEAGPFANAVVIPGIYSLLL